MIEKFEFDFLMLIESIKSGKYQAVQNLITETGLQIPTNVNNVIISKALV